MSVLNDYNQFRGLHWEAGSVRNYLAYCGFTAPHTGEPLSEALLMGISGGAVMGYFAFAYTGYDPHARILTRNTFDPLETLLTRLGAVQEIQQTSKAEKGVQNLIDTLADGRPAIVWADLFSLPYNALPYDEGMWGMMPILVYGYDADTVWIADRARVPLAVTPDELAAARARVKKEKFRILTLDLPGMDTLPAAVTAGIWDCINLYTEKPPRGSKNNFGLAAYQHWANLLTKPKQRQSWAKEFPPGRAMFAGLLSAFGDINTFGKEGHAERDVYADFLEEASALLEKPALLEVAGHFRRSAAAWDALSLALLPDGIAPLQEARELMLRWHALFLDQGNAALDEIRQIAARLDALKAEMADDFPLDDVAVMELRENVAAHVLRIRDIEEEAVTALRAAMA